MPKLRMPRTIFHRLKTFQISSSSSSSTQQLVSFIPQHGETDCWPMECPPVYCSHPVRLPGDCCLRCPDDDPCSAVEDVVSSSGEPLGCHHNGRNYTQGAEWAAGLDGCTNCKCKVQLRCFYYSITKP